VVSITVLAWCELSGYALPVPDLPAILDRIRAEPDAEAGWLALAAHLHDNGEYDLAVIMRHHWDAARDSLKDGLTVEQAIDQFRTMPPRIMRRIATRARESEERGLSDRATGVP
jgi:hypothetical protein